MEGRGFRDRTPELAEANAAVLGVSFDTVEDNRAFAEAEGFSYRLLSDADKAVSTAYDAVQGPGERFPGYPRRLTYLIDPAGVVRVAWEVGDVNTHADEVLATILTAAGH